jgi:hypothetical protein
MASIGRVQITNFILSNQNFLELAFAVEEAMLGGSPRENSDDAVRALLIRAVLESVADHARSQLDADWEIKISPHVKWGQMTIKRLCWPMPRNPADGRQYPVEIRLAPDNEYWQRVRIGFVAPSFAFPDPGCRAGLTAALLSVMPSGKADDWWAAFEWPSDAFRDWWDRRFLIDIGYAAYRARAEHENQTRLGFAGRRYTSFEDWLGQGVFSQPVELIAFPICRSRKYLPS